MLTIIELHKWTGITAFELFIHFVAFLVSSVLLSCKLIIHTPVTYWQVFLPLFAACGLNFYFLFIIFVRTVVEQKNQFRTALLGSIFNVLRVSLVALFEILLCHKIEGEFEHKEVAVQSTYGVVFTPVWILMTTLAFQACRLF